MDNLIDSVSKDIRYVIKRSGDKVVFKSEKIEMAILNAMKSIDRVDEGMAEKIARLTTKAFSGVIKKEFLMWMRFMIW